MSEQKTLSIFQSIKNKLSLIGDEKSDVNISKNSAEILAVKNASDQNISAIKQPEKSANNQNELSFEEFEKLRKKQESENKAKSEIEPESKSEAEMNAEELDATTSTLQKPESEQQNKSLNKSKNHDVSLEISEKTLQNSLESPINSPENSSKNPSEFAIPEPTVSSSDSDFSAKILAEFSNSNPEQKSDQESSFDLSSIAAKSMEESKNLLTEGADSQNSVSDILKNLGNVDSVLVGSASTAIDPLKIMENQPISENLSNESAVKIPSETEILPENSSASQSNELPKEQKLENSIEEKLKSDGKELKNAESKFKESENKINKIEENQASQPTLKTTESADQAMILNPKNELLKNLENQKKESKKMALEEAERELFGEEFIVQKYGSKADVSKASVSGSEVNNLPQKPSEKTSGISKNEASEVIKTPDPKKSENPEIIKSPEVLPNESVKNSDEEPKKAANDIEKILEGELLTIEKEDKVEKDKEIHQKPASTDEPSSKQNEQKLADNHSETPVNEHAAKLPEHSDSIKLDSEAFDNADLQQENKITDSLQKLLIAKKTAAAIDQNFSSEELAKLAEQILRQKIEVWIQSNINEIAERVIKEELKKIIG